MQSCKFCNGFKDKTENMALFHKLFKTTSKFQKYLVQKDSFFFSRNITEAYSVIWKIKLLLNTFLGKAGRYSIPLFE